MHGEAFDVRVVDLARRRHEPAKVDDQAQRVESLGRQELRVVVAEAEGGRVERRGFRHFVESVQQHDAPVRVGEPPPCARQWRHRARGAGGSRIAGLGAGGDGAEQERDERSEDTQLHACRFLQ